MAVSKLAVFCLLCISSAHGLSFLNKLRLHNFRVAEIKSGKMYTGKEVIGELCTDEKEEELCKSYIPYCKSHEYVRAKCAETCGECQTAYAPPNCQKSAYGCCWDNVTAAIGPEKKCPLLEKKKGAKPPPVKTCEDIGGHCSLMKIKCNIDAIRRICPVTCQVKCERCEDDVHQAPVCPSFKEIGTCTTDLELMKKYCKKTCGLC